MNEDQAKAAKAHEPLVCECCERDILETESGNFVWIKNPDRNSTVRFVGAYSACKGTCDKVMQVKFGVDRVPTGWTGINELMNPLEFERWSKATSRLIDRGELSAPVAIKVRELRRIVAPVADREPTEEDIIEYQELRLMDGL